MNKICFIVGHGKSKNGGYDSGAVSKDKKWHEFKIAREIAKFAQEFLNANYDVECDLMNYDGTLYLADRIKQVNANNYDFVAEFHLNAGGGTGTECFYAKGSTNGKKYAQAISKGIAEAFGIRNRGAKTRTGKSGGDYFGIIRQTECEAVLIETVFIDTASDLAKVKTDAGQKKCGEAVAQAVASVMRLKAIKNTTKTENPVKSPVAASDGTFKVKVICSALNIRTGAGTLYKKAGVITDKGVYTIVETNKAGTWGKLKSGAGWISIKPAYVERV